ncbi:hypothetical protein B0J14DRAFT_245465 [Halenospora varia]|nr:hypothetical protein B0J14DRAFT_245465 [Halenospora varia]
MADSARHVSVIEEMLASSKYSDFTIECKGHVFKVHRAEVCLQPKPLAAAADENFKEGVTGDIDFDDNEPDIVENMIRFMYTSDYSDSQDDNTTLMPTTATATPSKKARTTRSSLPATSASSPATTPTINESTEPLLTNAFVYVIADRYAVKSLKELTKKKYEEAVPDKGNSASFMASLKLLYEETAETDHILQDFAVKAAGDYIKEILDRGEFVTLCTERGILPWMLSRLL